MAAIAPVAPEQRVQVVLSLLPKEDPLELLKETGLIGRWKQPEITAHQTGFDQPAVPHEQWHTDIAYRNILACMSPAGRIYPTSDVTTL